MKKDIDEIKMELGKSLCGEEYVFPEGNDSFIRARYNGKKFMNKRFRNNPHCSDSIKLSDTRYLAEEYEMNGSFTSLVWSIYDLAFYRGYKKGQKEAKKE